MHIDEVDGEPDDELPAETRAILRMVTRVSEIAAPEESYWASYHARLRQKISHATAPRRSVNPVPFFAPLRRWVRFTVPVPVSLVVSMIIACAALAVFAFRPTPPPTPVVVHVPVEVPVVQEKTVTRVVYRDRRSPPKRSKRPNDAAQVESTFAQFKPTDDVKLIVIKGGSTNEN